MSPEPQEVPSPNLGTAVWTCPWGMRLEPTLELGSKEDSVLGQSQGQGWQGGMEEAGDMSTACVRGGIVSAIKLL